MPFEHLERADLVVDAVYAGGRAGNVRDDPIARLLAVGNQGGFRPRRKTSGEPPRILALYTDLGDRDWPDFIDLELGRLTYFGDNKRPGHALHDTAQGGNATLRDLFNAIHLAPAHREVVPPILVFSKEGSGRDVVFRGLAVPGASDLTPAQDLVAIWRTAGDKRFQNYRSVFTILDVPIVRRDWLDAIGDGRPDEGAPRAWHEWRERGLYAPLVAPRRTVRSRLEQLPRLRSDRLIVDAIRRYFVADPVQFEHCASELWRMTADNIEYELTRASADGGRDATGAMYLGPRSDPIPLTFALEAKCYAETNPVGVKEMSRLISRLRHREFGVLVTTSYVGIQAYTELRGDGHPVVVICAADIVQVLQAHGIRDVRATDEWLNANFPHPA